MEIDTEEQKLRVIRERENILINYRWIQIISYYTFSGLAFIIIGKGLREELGYMISIGIVFTLCSFIAAWKEWKELKKDKQEYEEFLADLEKGDMQQGKNS